jgi:hypothetical protein
MLCVIHGVQPGIAAPPTGVPYLSMSSVIHNIDAGHSFRLLSALFFLKKTGKKNVRILFLAV